jgi:hypothetical protein
MPAALARNPARLQADLDRLAGMDLAGLGARWRRVFGRAAPPSLSRALLARALAYRIQEIALGGLDREVAKALDRTAAGDGGSVIPLPGRGTVPGTLLVREWQGTLHRVMVLEEGFAWNGQTFESLSKVAFAITGTNWNGPRFFGLRQKGTSQDQLIGGSDERSAFSPLRHLHPGLDRARARAGVQLARQPA